MLGKVRGETILTSRSGGQWRGSWHSHGRSVSLVEIELLEII